jgi:hypothetical protein
VRPGWSGPDISGVWLSCTGLASSGVSLGETLGAITGVAIGEVVVVIIALSWLGARLRCALRDNRFNKAQGIPVRRSGLNAMRRHTPSRGVC